MLDRLRDALKARFGSAPALKEAPHTHHAVRVPGNSLVERTHKHFIKPQAVCAECFHQIIGIYDITLGFGHLAAVLG